MTCHTDKETAEVFETRKKWWTGNNCLFYCPLDIMYHQLSLNTFNTFCFSVSHTLINTHKLLAGGSVWTDAGDPRGSSPGQEVCGCGAMMDPVTRGRRGSRTRAERKCQPSGTMQDHTRSNHERSHVKHSLLEELDREDIRTYSAAGHFSRSLTTGEHNTRKPWIRAHLRSDSYWGLLVSPLIQSS